MCFCTIVLLGEGGFMVLLLIEREERLNGLSSIFLIMVFFVFLVVFSLFG